MKVGLVIFLTFIGLLVLYWILWGQRKYNKMFADEHIKKVETEIHKLETKTTKKKKTKKK